MKYDINANGPIGESNAKGDGEVGRLMSIVTATLGALGIDYIGCLGDNFRFGQLCTRHSDEAVFWFDSCWQHCYLCILFSVKQTNHSSVQMKTMIGKTMQRKTQDTATSSAIEPHETNIGK